MQMKVETSVSRKHGLFLVIQPKIFGSDASDFRSRHLSYTSILARSLLPGVTKSCPVVSLLRVACFLEESCSQSPYFCLSRNVQPEAKTGSKSPLLGRLSQGFLANVRPFKILQASVLIREMSPRGPSFSLFHKQIFPSTPITSFVLFLSYIVVTPLMIGFEKDFSCHSHLGPIRIPPLFPFLPEPFPRNEKEDGTLELYYLSAYCLPKILLLQLAGHRVIQISRVFRGFPMLQLPYQFDRSGMDRLNIPLGSPVLTLLCGIHSLIPIGQPSCSLHLTTSPTSLPPTVSRTSIETEWFHVLSSIGYSSPFVSPYPISVSISSQD